ncbi:MAG: general secretion pathway protein GspK [Novosphingobium sp.]|nr:general secretion pathway protein GspK [Novosphingobium sp.]
MTARANPGERGMILINVLIIVFLATTVLAILLEREDSDAERTIRMGEATQARAIADGAELSAVTELRRDLAAGSQVDTTAEKWAHIDDRGVAIDNGRFTFEVSDAQSQFNVNLLNRPDAWAQGKLRQIATAAGLDASVADRIAARLLAKDPVDDLAALADAGLTEVQLRQLGRFCTALPQPTDVNLNTAPEALVAVLMGNPAQAQTVVTMRKSPAGLSQPKLLAAGIVLPAGTGVTSGFFWARSRIEIGGTRQQLTSLIERSNQRGQLRVAAVERWRGAGPLQAPPLAPGA